MERSIDATPARTAGMAHGADPGIGLRGQPQAARELTPLSHSAPPKGRKEGRRPGVGWFNAPKVSETLRSNPLAAPLWALPAPRASPLILYFSPSRQLNNPQTL